MDSQCSRQPDWQVALAHHENLCAERYKSIEKHFDNIETDLRELRREMRVGQRWIIGLILASCFVMPAILFALLKFF